MAKLGYAFKGAYYIIKSIDLITRVNKWVLISLCSYATYRILKKLVYDPVRELINFMMIQTRPLTKLVIHYGLGTVIITGATTGLGPAYCKKLIQAGFKDFLLIDEDLSELQTLKENIQDYILQQKKEKEGINLETYLFDFDISYERDKFEQLELFMQKISKEKQISILINNFGKMHKGVFEHMEYWQISEMINANVNAVTYMTRFVLQNMTQQNSKCAIINVGSATAAAVKSDGRFNFSQYQIYQATKSYQTALTNLLQNEYPTIDFMNDIPATFNIYKKNLEDLGYKVTPENHVDQVLRSLGHGNFSHGSLRHTWMIYTMKHLYLFRPPQQQE